MEQKPTIWSKSRVQALVSSNDKAAIRALLVVYGNQTTAEKQTGSDIENNGIGFSKYDCELMTSFAKFYERVGFLTDKQLEILRKRIPSYWKQVLKAIEAKGLEVTYSRGK